LLLLLREDLVSIVLNIARNFDVLIYPFVILSQDVDETLHQADLSFLKAQKHKKLVGDSVDSSLVRVEFSSNSKVVTLLISVEIENKIKFLF
jgi:predicted nucleic acid-binding protein